MKIIWLRRTPITTAITHTLNTHPHIFPYDPDFPSQPYFSIPHLQNKLTQFPSIPFHLITFHEHFFQTHPQFPPHINSISHLDYPSILTLENLPFPPENIPFHFQTFAKNILTYFYIPSQPISLTITPYLEYLKANQFSYLTIEDWIFVALYIDFIPLEKVWSHVYYHRKKGLRLLLLREWAILLKQFQSHRFFHPEGCCRIPFLSQNNPSLLQSIEKGYTGVPLVDACIRAFHTLGYLPRAYLKFLIAFATKLWQIPWQWLFQQYLQHAKMGESLLEEITFLYHSGIGEDRITYVPFRLSQSFIHLDPQANLQKHWLPEIAHLSIAQLQQFPYLPIEEKRKLSSEYMKKVPKEAAQIQYKELEKSYYWRLSKAVKKSHLHQWQSPFLGSSS